MQHVREITLESFLGAEMTFQDYSRSSKMARFDRKHTISYQRSTVITTYLLPFVRQSEMLAESCELFSHRGVFNAAAVELPLGLL